MKSSSCDTCTTLDTKLTATATQRIANRFLLFCNAHSTSTKQFKHCMLCPAEITFAELPHMPNLKPLGIPINPPPLRAACAVSAGSELQEAGDLPPHGRGIHPCAATGSSPGTARGHTEPQPEAQEPACPFQNKDNRPRCGTHLKGIILKSLLLSWRPKYLP